MFADRPLIFVDLDDTLFQTARKMGDGKRYAATVDTQGNTSGYMNPVQKSFVQWLLTTADVVPVTARSVEAYRRVKLPFTHGAICAHGGVMIRPDGTLDQDWHMLMSDALQHEQERLPKLSQSTLQIGAESGFSLRGWVVEESGLKHYVVTKSNETSDDVLQTVLSEVEGRNLLDGLYVHKNGNNLAFLPKALQKKKAVREWIRRDIEIFGERPCLAFGDSISDLGFMTECHWWGTPHCGQLANKVTEVLINE